jgi:hypothetical protein
MEWLSGALDQVFTFFQYIWDFLTTGIYTLIKETMVILTKAALYSFIQMQIFALEVAFEAAQDIVNSIGITQQIKQMYSGLPAEVLSGLSFFGIPQALNILFSGLSTRFVLRFVPFIGR